MTKSTRSYFKGQSLRHIVVVVLAGALVYGLWQDWQGREYSAKWEIKTRQIALAFTLIHAMILPSLWFGVFATTWLLIIALVGLGVWLYRAANTVVALFVPIITVWTLCYFFINQSSAYDIQLIVLGLAAGGAILTAAFGLHLPSWQNPHKKLPSTYFILGLFALLISLIALIDTFNLQIKHSFDLDLQFDLTWAMFLSFAVFALAFHIVKFLMGRHWQSPASVNLSFMVMISMMLVSLAHNHHTTAHIVLLGVVSLMLSLWIVAEQRLSPSTANWVHCVHLGLVLGAASYLFGQSLNASVAYLWGIASLMLWAGLVYVPFTWKTAFVQTYQQWGQLLCMLIASIWLLDVAISTPIVIGTRLPLLNATDIMTVLLAVLWYHSIQNTQPGNIKTNAHDGRRRTWFNHHQLNCDADMAFL